MNSKTNAENDIYSQMDKNNVSSKGQLNDSPCVRFRNPNGNGVRVLFVGNSITLHGVCPEIGWYGEWGMAASAEEKDYVHIMEAKIAETEPDAAFCVCQVAEWERQYKNGTEVLAQYENARRFAADIIILRFVENVPKAEYECSTFKRELEKLVKYLDGTGKAKIIVTTGYWRHPGDDALISFAAEKEYPCVELGDLGEDVSTSANGLFEHRGVAHHPGDKGMQLIADRIFDVLIQKNCLKIVIRR